jgi:hypothetical protein
MYYLTNSLEAARRSGKRAHAHGTLSVMQGQQASRR